MVIIMMEKLLSTVVSGPVARYGVKEDQDIFG